jgi:hypothetical protein
LKLSSPDAIVRAEPRLASRPAAATRRSARVAPALLAGLALLHGLLFAWLLPPWQTPDEPSEFEYAALVSELGRVPAFTDVDPALERRIAGSLTRQHFFEYLTGHSPPTTPRTMDDVRAIFFMPRQVGSDPPLYFMLAALPIRLMVARSIEAQLLALRLIGVLLTAGAVLCAYAAGRELLPRGGFAFAAGLIVALQPMFVFIGVGAGNDSLANLIGAALCWCIVLLARRGFSPRRAVALLALMLLGLFTKRTLLPEILLLALLAGGWAIVRLARVPWPLLARLGAALALLLVVGLGARAAIAGSRSERLAADWVDPPTGADAPRVLSSPGASQPALELAPGAIALQALPDITAEWAQNQPLDFRARVWTANGTARGVVAIDFGWAKTEIPFVTDKRTRFVQVQTFVPLYCPYVHVVLRSEEGMIYADQLIAESDRRRGLNLLSNADVTTPGLRPGAPLAQLRRYLRARELAWVWRSGRLLEPPPLGWDLARIFFASFWGQFGWMSLPLVGATPWEGALALVCLGGMLGTLGWLASPHCAWWQRRAVGVLLLVVACEMLFPLLNAYTQPRSQAIQQGRYLFPALAPLALLLTLGWRAFVPPRWRVGALIVGGAFAALFAVAALDLIVRFYQRS